MNFSAIAVDLAFEASTETCRRNICPPTAKRQINKSQINKSRGSLVLSISVIIRHFIYLLLALSDTILYGGSLGSACGGSTP